MDTRVRDRIRKRRDDDDDDMMLFILPLLYLLVRYNEDDSENEVGAMIPYLRSEGEEDDASVQPTEEEEAASVEATSVPRSVDVASRNRDEKEPKRHRKNGNIEGLMESYLDMRIKQVEDEAAQLAKEKEISQGSDFSIKRCISVLNTLEVTKVEKAKAYEVFKNPDNRQIFLSAYDEDQESTLIWLRNEMAYIFEGKVLEFFMK